MITFGITTNTTCWFGLKQYNPFYTVQKHEICPFLETLAYGALMDFKIYFSIICVKYLSVNSNLYNVQSSRSLVFHYFIYKVSCEREVTRNIVNKI